MLNIALWEPEIPPNTGNVARLCAATGARLHLIGRLGFQLDDRALRRAGLDYWSSVDCQRHTTLADVEALSSPGRLFILSAHATRLYTEVNYQSDDWLLFGSETRGLPDTVHERYRSTSLTVPMPGGNVRSLNLATSVGIILYEALRQIHGW